MKEQKYKKIIALLAGVLVTELVHIRLTTLRGYKAIGGEFLLIPISIAIYYFYWLVRARWEETEEYFKGKDNV